MQKHQYVPGELKVVAYLFIATGILALVGMAIALTQRHLSINLVSLGVLIGPGLLAHRRAWRTCALVMIWLTLIVLVAASLMLFGANARMTGIVAPLPMWITLIFVLVYFAVTIWQYRVLTRADVVRLFNAA